jgi:hypothetical protein
MKITKEYLDVIAAYRDDKNMHADGSILMVSKDTVVSKEILEYAKSKKIEIQLG